MDETTTGLATASQSTLQSSGFVYMYVYNGTRGMVFLKLLCKVAVLMNGIFGLLNSTNKV